MVLTPKKVEKHIANVVFDKQGGRPEKENSEDPPEGDILVINPREVERHLPNLDFGKQAARPEVVIEKDENDEVNVVEISVEKKVKGVPFARLSSVRMVPVLRKQSKLKRESEADEK